MAKAWVEIPLHSQKYPGLVTKVDVDDYELAANHHWFPDRRLNTFYVRANIRCGARKTTVLLHKMITGYSETDHRNRNGLDNRRSNLRSATRAQNNGNKPSQRGSKSSYKGVSWDARSQRWCMQIRRGGNRYTRHFANESDAARAYDAKARELFGEYAYLNFSDC